MWFLPLLLPPACSLLPCPVLSVPVPLFHPHSRHNGMDTGIQRIQQMSMSCLNTHHTGRQAGSSMKERSSVCREEAHTVFPPPLFSIWGRKGKIIGREVSRMISPCFLHWSKPRKRDSGNQEGKGNQEGINQGMKVEARGRC